MNSYTSQPIIKAVGLYKSYPSGQGMVHPLQGIDISLYPGEFIAVKGASGTGKSTLLHILGCLERPDKGTYHLDGKDVSRLDDTSLSLLRATRIGFIFQAYNLISQCSLIENTVMPFLYHPNPPDNTYALALSALEKVGLSDRKTHKPSQLSGGEMQRAAIARALVINPLVVLADEPTGNLDSENSMVILSLFRQVHERGASLVVVTHDDDVAGAADRTIHIKDGRISD
ncbi:MAG TPA: ABC transporter ATP-binding protein [Desulfobacteraceae bacterium]|nr:ABC transporter ATP-binding protein [Desulfobacteraceae bacterium]HPJ68155.1 ABC transporter ATP-binding protein [Desulfobacteraceae bacterium]HPQ28947.1 ABC transporter ATP-binding protein [Desulfobacteraceae bacterium]